MKKRVVLSILLAECLWLACCGNKGPLVLEPPIVLPPVQELSLRQRGNAIQIEWTFPAMTADGKSAIEMEKIARVFIYRSDARIPLEKFAKKADLLAKITLRELQHVDQRTYSALLQLKMKELKGRKYFFAIGYEWNKKHAELTRPMAIETLVPPAPIKDVKLTQEKKTLVLRWSRPALDITGSPLAQAKGYYIYRSVQGDKENAPLRRLTFDPLMHEYFEDTDLRLEGEYQYTVTTLLSPQVESDYSNRSKLKITDIFPPDTPQTVVAFTGPDHILLTWEPVHDTDLSLYRVYRKDKENGEFKLLEDNIKENLFKDFKAKRGLFHYYAVTAVDRRGNESDFSRTVTHEFQ